MNKTNLSRLFVIAALILNSTSLRAAVLTNNLSFALTFIRQGESTNAAGAAQKVERFRVSNKEIIGVLAMATTNRFASGSSLQLIATNPAMIFVIGKGGIVLADVSRFFSFEFATNQVQQSKDASIGATVRTSYSIVRATFDDGQGNSFDLSGAATDQYRTSAAKSGLQKETGSLLLDAAGPGQSGGRFAVAKGKIKLNGTDTIAATP